MRPNGMIRHVLTQQRPVLCTSSSIQPTNHQSSRLCSSVESIEEGSETNAHTGKKRPFSSSAARPATWCPALSVCIGALRFITFLLDRGAGRPGRHSIRGRVSLQSGVRSRPSRIFGIGTDRLVISRRSAVQFSLVRAVNIKSFECP